MKIKIFQEILIVITALLLLSINSMAQISIDKPRFKNSKSSLPSYDQSITNNLNKLQNKKQKDFTFNVNLYLWTISMDGKAAVPVNNPMLTIKQTPVVNVSLKFTDAIKNVKFAIMLAGKFMYKNVGLSYDVDYVKLKYDGSVPVQSTYISGTMTAKQFTGDFALLYNFPIKKKNILFSSFAGTRVFSMNNTIDLKNAGNSIFTNEQSKTWADLIIGADARIDFSKHWLTYLKADAGGFGISSKFTGSIAWVAGYKFTKHWNVTLGFKYLYVDYDKDNFLWQVSQYGLLLSFGYIF